MDKKKLILTLAGWAMLAAVAYDKFFKEQTAFEIVKGVIGFAIVIIALGALWVGYGKLIEYVHDKDPSGVTGNIITMLLAAIVVLILIR